MVQQYELALNVTLAVQLNGILDTGFQTHQEDQSCSETCNALCDEPSITIKSTVHQGHAQHSELDVCSVKQQQKTIFYKIKTNRACVCVRVCVCVCVCVCVMKQVYPYNFVSALGSYEMGRHK